MSTMKTDNTKYKKRPDTWGSGLAQVRQSADAECACVGVCI